MIDIEIPISTSERSSGWAINYIMTRKKAWALGSGVLGIKIYNNFNEILGSGSSLLLIMVRCPQVVPLCAFTLLSSGSSRHVQTSFVILNCIEAQCTCIICISYGQNTLVFSYYYCMVRGSDSEHSYVRISVQ